MSHKASKSAKSVAATCQENFIHQDKIDSPRLQLVARPWLVRKTSTGNYSSHWIRFNSKEKAGVGYGCICKLN